MKLKYPCPDCSSKFTRRSSKRWLERCMIGLKPFRCSRCQHRFYAPMSLPKLYLGRHLAALCQEFNPLRRISLHDTHTLRQRSRPTPPPEPTRQPPRQVARARYGIASTKLSRI